MNFYKVSFSVLIVICWMFKKTYSVGDIKRGYPYSRDQFSSDDVINLNIDLAARKEALEAAGISWDVSVDARKKKPGESDSDFQKRQEEYKAKVEEVLNRRFGPSPNSGTNSDYGSELFRSNDSPNASKVSGSGLLYKMKSKLRRNRSKKNSDYGSESFRRENPDTNPNDGDVEDTFSNDSPNAPKVPGRSLMRRLKPKINWNRSKKDKARNNMGDRRSPREDELAHENYSK